MPGTRAADDELRAARRELQQQKEELTELKKLLDAANALDKRRRSTISKQHHELVRLRAAQEQRDGAVSFMGPNSGMWSKEVDSHILWLKSELPWLEL